MNAILSFIGGLVFKVFALGYALFTLVLAIAYGLSQKDTWTGPSESDEKHFREACHDLWALSKTDRDFSHHFLVLPRKLQLHYITPVVSPTSYDALVIFLHGFPDSSYIWADQLRSLTASNAKLVALDLPGCGGSDSLASYGPDEMLNTVSEAFAQLKVKYLKTSASGKCVVVSHDWGGVISFRLAAETTGLVDEMIVLNSSYPLAASEQIKHHLARSRTLLSAARFREALADMQAVLSQIRKSHYIFFFNLPFPLAKWMPWLANSLVKFCHGLAHQHLPHILPSTYATSMALSCGPGELESASHSPDGYRYSASVRSRARTFPQGDWDERIRIYREKLATGEWTREYTGCQPLKRSSTQRDGKFNCAMNVIYGMKDIALDARIMLDGIENYFCPENSEVETVQEVARRRITRLPDCGHWCMLEPEGAKTLEDMLTRVLR